MDKLRSTLKQVVRDWSEEVGNATLLKKKKAKSKSIAGKGGARDVLHPHG